MSEPTVFGEIKQKMNKEANDYEKSLVDDDRAEKAVQIAKKALLYTKLSAITAVIATIIAILSLIASMRH